MPLFFAVYALLGCTLPPPTIACATIAGTPTPGNYTSCSAREEGAGAVLFFSDLAGCSGCRTTITIDDLEAGAGYWCDDPGYSVEVRDDAWGSQDYTILASGEDSFCFLTIEDFDPADEFTPWEGSVQVDAEVFERGVWGYATNGDTLHVDLQSLGD